MEWVLLLAAFCFALGAGITCTYLFLRPRLQATQELADKTARQNGEISLENERLFHEHQELERARNELANYNDKLKVQKEAAQEQLVSLGESITAMERQAQNAADLFYQSKMEVAQNKLDQDLAIITKQHEENIRSFQEGYADIVADAMDQFKELSDNVAVLRATNDAAVAAAKRAAEMKDQQAFYRIQLSDADIHEIELLRQVEPYLRDKEPLNKVIWKCYYEKPTTDMIGRVVGSGVKTGIYKLTEIETGKCYVGQAANIADRWKQHIKRGVGAETPTRNKLYPAMIAAGPENFTFEVIEICDRAALDAREDYWQDYFKAKEFGYSIK